MALVLHQAGAGEIIELVDAVFGEIGLDAFEQRQIFAQGHRDLGGAQIGEEAEEHRATVASNAFRSSCGGSQAV